MDVGLASEAGACRFDFYWGCQILEAAGRTAVPDQVVWVCYGV